jgi:hypothetical protein
VAAGLGGPALVAVVASAGAVTPPVTVTLGSTTGTPSANLCGLSINCTYAPFSGVSPELQVPADGTVTSFSINSGSATGHVELRVLRPASGGEFTGAGTSAPELLAGTVSTFAVSLPVQAGDILAIDNDSSALLFDTSSSTSITAYYELPALADGATAAPSNYQVGDKLLLAATVVEAPPTSTTTTTVTAPANPAPIPPSVTHPAQSNRTWREGSKLAVISGKPKPPVGTTFSFKLNQSARVTFTFTQQVTGRTVSGKCVAETKTNRSKRSCKRTVTQGTLSFSGRSGENKVAFQGRVSHSRKLPSGGHKLLIGAVNTARQRSKTVSLSFTIAS